MNKPAFLPGIPHAGQVVWDTARQGEPGWIKARIGRLTASKMADAMATLKKGGESEARRKLKIALLAERLSDAATEHFVSDAMLWGIEHEAEAAAAYEQVSGELLTACGLAYHPTIEWFAASPDRLLNADGLVEVKCPTSLTHVAWLLAGVVPDQHKPQMLAQLACTRRRYVDFVSFDPRLPLRQRLFVRRFEPAADEISAVEEAARQFLAEVDAMFEQLTTTEV